MRKIGLLPVVFVRLSRLVVVLAVLVLLLVSEPLCLSSVLSVKIGAKDGCFPLAPIDPASEDLTFSVQAYYKPTLHSPA